jgi:phosphoribosyl 1,2-cyclic phosphodiesterase
VRAGRDLYVFDAGRGLVVLADAVLNGQLGEIERVHVLVTHAHMDHWEGLKDAGWLWRRGNNLALSLIAPGEALAAIKSAHAPPSFVDLEVLALGTLARFEYRELSAGSSLALPGARLDAVALHHYSGMAPHKHYLDTLGYVLTLDAGPAVAYLSDHEPTAATATIEESVLALSQLAIVDSNYGAVADHAFGHGSIEYAAALARAHPTVQIVAGHHGPLRSDDVITGDLARFGAGCANLDIAREGDIATWDPAVARFQTRRA